MSTRMSRARALCVILAVAALPAVASAANDLHALESRVQAIEDRLAIEDLVAGRYSMALDTADPDAYAALFTKDAFLSVAGRPFKGRKAILRMMVQLKKQQDVYDTRPGNINIRRWGPVRHVVTNPVIKITGDTAASDTYSVEIGSNGRDPKGWGRPQSIMNVCRYEDNLVKQDGKWLISKRLITCDMFGRRSMAPDTYPQTMAPSEVSP
jgi:uncharacterized protein (TIGR02246 family)